MMDFCLKNIKQERDALFEKRRYEIKANMVIADADNKARMVKYFDDKYGAKKEAA